MVDAGGGWARRARIRHESFLKKNGNPKYRIPIAGGRSRNGGLPAAAGRVPQGRSDQPADPGDCLREEPARAREPEVGILAETSRGRPSDRYRNGADQGAGSVGPRHSGPLRAGQGEAANRGAVVRKRPHPQELGKVLVTSQAKTSWTDTLSCYTGLSERGKTATAVLDRNHLAEGGLGAGEAGGEGVAGGAVQ